MRIFLTRCTGRVVLKSWGGCHEKATIPRSRSNCINSKFPSLAALFQSMWNSEEPMVQKLHFPTIWWTTKIWTKPGATWFHKKCKSRRPLSRQKNLANHWLLSTSVCDSPSECDEVPGASRTAVATSRKLKTHVFRIKNEKFVALFLLKTKTLV